MARKGRWEDHLVQELLTKPAEVVQEVCQVLEKHGCSVKKLKSELYYTITRQKFCGRKFHTEKFCGRKFCNFVQKQAFRDLCFDISRVFKFYV